ncbi:hypothetical protein QMS70_05645 [Cronobacter sakazakii]
MKTEGTQNNDELISAGHELAKRLDSNTPLLDIAKMIVRLADKLDVTTAALREKTKQCEQLAAENAALNEKMNTLATWPDIEFYSSSWEFNNGDGNDALEFMCDVQTPATDAFLREVRASAVDAACLKISNSIVSCRQDEMIGLDEAVNIASNFAAELRQGGAA